MEKKNNKKNTRSPKKNTEKKEIKKTVTNKRTKTKKRGKAFTLIELLAVIIILGVLMIIAIPAVTEYINNSRKASYISSAKNIISGARNLVNQGTLEMYDTGATYYIPATYIDTENGTRSPYGDFTQAYIGVIYDGRGYKYYWISNDSTGQGIRNITSQEKLDNNLIESDIKDFDIRTTVETTGILGREKILILDANGHWEEARIATSNLNDNGNVVNVAARFRLNNQYYEFDPGMTWGEWVNSQYNTINAVKHESLDLIYTNNDGYACNSISAIYNYYVISNNNAPVSANDTINKNNTYQSTWDSCHYAYATSSFTTCDFGTSAAC